jgi:hypothetical protein
MRMSAAILSHISGNERLLGIAKKLMNFLAIPNSLSHSYIFDISALLGDNLN